VTFWLLSNNDAITDDDGRRYFILPISTEHLRDLVYFGNIRDTCFNKEVGDAYYNFLMEIDLKGFNSQDYPITESKLDSIAKRLDNVYKFLKDHYILEKKGINKVKVSNLFAQYENYCTKYQFKAKNKIDFNRMLEEVGIRRHKNDSVQFYNETYESLNALADKFHWIHALDEALENNECMFNNDDKTTNSIVEDKAEYIRVEEYKKIVDKLESLKEYNIDIHNDLNESSKYIKELEKYIYRLVDRVERHKEYENSRLEIYEEELTSQLLKEDMESKIYKNENMFIKNKSKNESWDVEI
jgi:hypothetical protein